MCDNLVEYLKKLSDAYYNSPKPLVSDATYDAIVDTLRRLDPSNEYLKSVGAKVPRDSQSDKILRGVPMGTLTKYHKEEEVKRWLDSEGEEYVLLSPKYDGFAVELVYIDGLLISAGTRGDGYEGEDILKAAMRIRNIPLNIEQYKDTTIIVRGEAIIPTKNHEKIKALGYSAMRNAVPGIVRSCREEALGYVDFVAYEFIDGFEHRQIQREFWKEYFIVEDYRVYKFSDISGMMARREELRASEYLYELDGVVLKTDKIKEDDLLNPSHMIAWKYKSNRETTILRGIEYQLGVTGYFTPIGIFDPVEFQGATLTRASLGNMTRLTNEFEGLTIGSMIEVSRRGDIIPYIEGMVLINDEGEKIEPLRVCPHCGHLLEIDCDTDDINDKYEPHCVNHSCPEKLRLQISQYARSIGIKGIGDKLVRGLIDAEKIKSIVDIYTVDPNCILELPRQGQSAVDKWKMLTEKKLSPVELLTAYPFLDLGIKVWENVLSKYSLTELLDVTHDDLVNARLKGIGESKIESIVSQVKENRVELESLMSIMF